MTGNFLTRKYIDNIFKSKVEESLVEIQRMRNGLERYNQKKEATGREPSDSVWRQSDLMTSEGSIYAFALLLLNKLEE